MKSALFAAAALAAIAATPSQALTFNIVYTGNTTGNLTFTTANTLNGYGGYTITSASGTVAGEAVTLIPGGPAPFGVPGFNVDNVYFAADPIFDSYGLALQSATGIYNLWGNGAPNDYTLYKYENGGYSITGTGHLEITAVPEPASWALLIAGFGLIGLAARRRATLATANA